MNKSIQFLPLAEEILHRKCEDAMALPCHQVPLGTGSPAGCSSPASQLAAAKVLAIFVCVHWKEEKTLCAFLYQYDNFSTAVI